MSTIFRFDTTAPLSPFCAFAPLSLPSSEHSQEGIDSETLLWLWGCNHGDSVKIPKINHEEKGLLGRDNHSPYLKTSQNRTYSTYIYIISDRGTKSISAKSIWAAGPVFVVDLLFPTCVFFTFADWLQTVITQIEFWLFLCNFDFQTEFATYLPIDSNKETQSLRVMYTRTNHCCNTVQNCAICLWSPCIRRQHWGWSISSLYSLSCKLVLGNIWSRCHCVIYYSGRTRNVWSPVCMCQVPPVFEV